MTRFSTTKTIIIVFFICLTSVTLHTPFVYSKDLREDFEIVSPKYAQEVNYILQDPSFKITAPRDWYMAMKKDATMIMGEPRVIFFKYNPEVELAIGDFGMPSIEIKFWPNPEKVSSLAWSKDIVLLMENTLEKRGMNILLQPEAIEVNGHKGAHFRAPHPTGSFISDSYIIEIKDSFVSITANYKSSENIEAEIKETINSIKF